MNDTKETTKEITNTADWEIVFDNKELTFVSCSGCGYGNYLEEVKFWRFCPMCGDRMEGLK